MNTFEWALNTLNWESQPFPRGSAYCYYVKALTFSFILPFQGNFNFFKLLFLMQRWNKMDYNPWIDDCLNYKQKLFGVGFLAYPDLKTTNLWLKKKKTHAPPNITCINMVCFSNLKSLKEVHSFVLFSCLCFMNNGLT